IYLSRALLHTIYSDSAVAALDLKGPGFYLIPECIFAAGLFSCAALGFLNKKIFPAWGLFWAVSAAVFSVLYLFEKRALLTMASSNQIIGAVYIFMAALSAGL